MEERFESFVRMITNIHRSINRIKSMEMSEFGLKGNHTLCLYYLNQHSEGLSSNQLAKICEEDKAAISRTLNELETGGYVFLKSEQKYRARYFLSGSGKEAAANISRAVEQVLDQVGDFFTEKERKKFYCALEKIDRQLEEYPAAGNRKAE
ncbi:MAG: hypothetical protein EOM64_04440 [Erysipelotrichia bacterium]|nr:hypothetical protein [Erysipelotrichia bacterium]